MTQNYENLLQDMLSAKKDFNQLRVRNVQLECIAILTQPNSSIAGTKLTSFATKTIG